MSRQKILFLAHLLPWPLEGGGQIKSYHVLKTLAGRYDIRMLAFIRSDAERGNAAPLEPLCALGVELVALPRGKARDLRLAAASLLSGRSFIVARDDVPAMHAALARALDEGGWAAIHVDHLQMASFIPPDTRGAKVVLDQHNVEHRIPQRLVEAPPPGLKGWLFRLYGAREWPRLRDFERSALQRADLTLAVSDEDQYSLQALLGENSRRIITVPIGVDTEFFGAVCWRPGSLSLLSIGTMYWPPNVDAMLYFCEQIYPKIKRATKGVELKIVGARPTAQVQALAADPTVAVTGLVPDVRPWAEGCGCFIVPLRSGSGMRVKILNAMAMGLPIVSTSVGAEGIEVTDGKDILLADTPEAFADAVVRVLSDPALAMRLGAGGKELMARRYSWEVVGHRLLTAYEEALA